MQHQESGSYSSLHPIQSGPTNKPAWFDLILMEGLGWIKLRLKLDSVLVVKAAEFPRPINPLEISGLNPGGGNILVIKQQRNDRKGYGN